MCALHEFIKFIKCSWQKSRTRFASQHSALVSRRCKFRFISHSTADDNIQRPTKHTFLYLYLCTCSADQYIYRFHDDLISDGLQDRTPTMTYSRLNILHSLRIIFRSFSRKILQTSRGHFRILISSNSVMYQKKKK